MLSQHVHSLKSLLSFLSSASLKELTNLPNIGQKKAKNIITLRETDRVTLNSLSSLRGFSSKFFGTLSGDHYVTDIVDICKYVNSYYGSIKCPNNVVSIDLGLNEMGVAYISRSDGMGMSLREWKRVQLVPIRPYTPEGCHKQVSSLFSQLPNNADSYVIEAQSHRPAIRGGGKGYMDISLRLRLLESVIYTVGIERGLNIYRVSPQKVGRYFNLESGRYSRKKQASVVKATQLLGVAGMEQLTTPLGVSLQVANDNLKDFYCSQKKMDDLSDCLLGGIAFMEWTYLNELINSKH